VLPDALAFSNDADAMRECSKLAVTTIPFAGNRDPCRALTGAAREGATVTTVLRDGRGAALMRSATERHGPQRADARTARAVHNTVKARCLMLSKEMF